MANGVKLIGYKADIDNYKKVKKYADQKGLSISDLLREAVKHFLTEDKHTTNEDKQILTELETVKQQLEVKDEQISELHQLLAMKENNMDTMVKQLQDMRNRSVWTRIKNAIGFSTT